MDLQGHQDVRTTMIETDGLNRGPLGGISPAAFVWRYEGWLSDLFASHRLIRIC
jgi:hypothetical protein